MSFMRRNKLQGAPPEVLEMAFVMALREMDKHQHEVSPALKKMWADEWEQRKQAKALFEEPKTSSITLQL